MSHQDADHSATQVRRGVSAVSREDPERGETVINWMCIYCHTVNSSPDDSADTGSEVVWGGKRELRDDFDPEEIEAMERDVARKPVCCERCGTQRRMED